MSFPPYSFSIFFITVSFGAVLLQDETGDRTSDSLPLPFCQVPPDVCWETGYFITASCGLSVFGIEPFRQAIGKRKCSDGFVTEVDVAASGTAAAAPPSSPFEAGEETPSVAYTVHGQDVIFGGTGWNGEPLNEPFEGVVFQNIFCDGEDDPQCYPSCPFPLWWIYAPHSTSSSDDELFLPGMGKTDDFAMGLIRQSVGTASSDYREIC